MLLSMRHYSKCRSVNRTALRRLVGVSWNMTAGHTQLRLLLACTGRPLLPPSSAQGLRLPPAARRPRVHDSTLWQGDLAQHAVQAQALRLCEWLGLRAR